jgi:large subunit ribosomal protein L3
MAGQHGSKKTTTLNLEVVEGDPERGLLLVKGSVPGANGSLVFVRNAVKGPKSGPYEPRAKKEAPVADDAAPDADAAESDAEGAPAGGVSPPAATDAIEASDAMEMA